MSTAIDVVTIINNYLKSHKTIYINYEQFLDFSKEFVSQYEANNPNFADLRADTHQTLSAHIKSLHNDGLIQIESDQDQNTLIYYEAFFHEQISEYYQKILADLTLVLPGLDTLEIPKNKVHPVNIKEEFLDLLRNSDESPKIIRIAFPNDIGDVIATTNIKDKLLPLAAIQKIRQYLHKENCYAYIVQKFQMLYPSKEIPIKNLLLSISQSADAALNSILDPSNFSFQLWTQLASIIIKECESKYDKTLEDNNYIQASYLIGYYCMRHRESLQKKNVDSRALFQLKHLMQKPPYAYTHKELQELRDHKEQRPFKNISPESFQEFILSELEKPEDADIAPLARLAFPNKEALYIYVVYVGHVLKSETLKASRNFHDFYKNSWYSAMMEDDILNTMDNDREFHNHTRDRLRKNFPIFFVLLDFDFLNRIVSSGSIPKLAKKQCQDYIHPQRNKLKEINSILSLDRKQILLDSRTLLPAWLSIPILKHFAFFFRRILLGKKFVEKYQRQRFDHEGQYSIKKKDEEQESDVTRKVFSVSTDEAATLRDSKASPSSQSDKLRKAAFKEHIKSLESEFAQDGKTAELSMKNLIHVWNPLIDPDMRNNLVEDVNSICRDYLRRRRFSYRSTPPDAAAIREISRHIVDDDVFERVRSRKALEQYIQLYLLKLLSSSSR